LLATIARLSDRCATRGLLHIATPPESSNTRVSTKRGGAIQSTHEPLVDEAKLAELLQLGLDHAFFEELVSGFLRDGDSSLLELASAIDARDYPRLRGAIHALQGSAGEFGATRIVAVCGELKQLKPFELGSPRARKLLQDARQAFSRTSVVLTEFAQKECDAIT
jgi:HPt (histidine-containing phosphotransfer) domain-containing protein